MPTTTSHERVLSALAEDVDAATIDDLLTELAEDMSGVEMDALRTIATKLRGARRREELLRVLHDTATDLTAIRDVEAVLQAIVARTRQLVGSDMAYLSLNDYPHQETYIRKSDGVVTPEYRTIRMPLGTGVLGKVATGLSPVAVTDYLTEPDIVHLPHIDRIVKGEGVKTIMGVPLTVHGRVLGALLVAERSRRRFTAEEIDLVDSVGKHAAVAIDNAQRFAEVTEALSRLGAARTADEATLASVQALLDLDEMLLEVVVRGRSYTDLLAAAHRALPYPAVFIHPDGHVLGSVGVVADRLELAVPDVDWLATESDEARALIAAHSRTARATGRAQVVTLASGPATVTAALAADQFLGTIVVRGELAPEERSLLERVAVFSAVMRLFGRATQAAEFQQQGELLDAVMSGRAGRVGVVAERLARFGLGGAEPMTVLLVEPSGVPMADRIRRALRAYPLLAAVHEDHICVLVATSATTASSLIAAECATEEVNFRISHVARVAIEDLPVAHRLSKMGLAVDRRLNRWGVTDAAQLGAIGAVVEAASFDDEVTTRAIRPLLAYDAAHESSLAETALTYLDSDANVGATAQRMFLHRNTVRQRLGRVGKLLGEDWSSGPRRLDSHLALRLWALMRSAR